MVTLTPLRTDVPDEVVSRLAAVLSNDEHARAARFRHAEDRRRYVVTRASLRQLLAQQSGMDAQSLVFSTLEHGKPVLAGFDRHGEAQPSLHFNVTHSGAWAAIVLGQDPVGVDIEQRRSLDVVAVGTHLFDASVLQAIVQAADPEAAFLTAWTAREALLKARGTGLTDAAPTRVQETTIFPAGSPPVVRDDNVCIEPFEVAPDYYGAVCTLAPSMTLIRLSTVDSTGRLPTFF